MTSRSLREIGRRFGGRDHTTIMHGVKKIEELRGADHSLSEDIDLLHRLLEAWSESLTCAGLCHGKAPQAGTG